MIHLGSVEVPSGGQANMSFTSIPQTFQHLKLLVFSRTLGASSQDESYLTFNSNSSNYDAQFFTGNGSSFSVDNPTYTTVIFTGRIPASTATSGVYAFAVIDIFDYANTTKTKSVKFTNGYHINSSGFLHFGNGLWNDLSAINALTFRSNPNFAQYSSAHLYGIESSPVSGV